MAVEAVGDGDALKNYDLKKKLTEKGQDQVSDVRRVGVGPHELLGAQELGAVVAESDEEDAAFFDF